MSLVAVCCGLSRLKGARERSRATAARARIDGPSRHPAAAAAGAAIYCGSLRRLIAAHCVCLLRSGRRIHREGQEVTRLLPLLRPLLRSLLRPLLRSLLRPLLRPLLRSSSRLVVAEVQLDRSGGLLRLIASYCEQVYRSGPTRQLPQPAWGLLQRLLLRLVAAVIAGSAATAAIADAAPPAVAAASVLRLIAGIAAYCGLLRP